MRGRKFHLYVCGGSECPTVGSRRSSPTEALKAWNDAVTEIRDAHRVDGVCELLIRKRKNEVVIVAVNSKVSRG